MQMNQPTHNNRSQRGLTLVETAVTLLVSLTAFATGLPSFQAARDKQAMQGVAAQLETDIQYARSLAVARHQSVRISFPANPVASCYVIHTGGASDCSCNAQGQAQCVRGSEVLRTASNGGLTPIAIRSNSASMLLDPTNGTVTPTGTVQVQGRGGKTLKVIVNVTGRVRSCAATAGLPGFARC
jgi:type IV fimbrial biogenesis protein FimT